MIGEAFWKGKRVMLTGHTGFKGSWLSIWLIMMGADVTGYALDPYTEKDAFVLSGLSKRMNDVRGDIRNERCLRLAFEENKPEIVFHLAAQPLVRESYVNPVETYETNVMGTINVLECIRNTDNCKVAVFITTDKCYENKEQLYGYKENDLLGGHDPYSSSKAACEIAIGSWRSSFLNPKNYHDHHKAIASARAGNVIGGGDWAKDRIVPDCVRAIEMKEPVRLRNPLAVRPWQHVLEPLHGYIMLAEKLWNEPEKYSEAWNFGPYINSVITVGSLAGSMVKAYGQGEVIDESDPNALHEAQLLSLDISKTVLKLGWKPVLNIERTIDFTAEWYKNYRNVNAYDLCTKQIESYSKEIGKGLEQ